MTHAAAAASLVFTGAGAACLAYLHLAPTGTSPLRNAVSEYGVGPYARWYAAQASCTGLAGLALAIALRHPGGVVVLLVVLAVTRVAIGWFPTDTIAVGERTTRGAIHLLLAAAAFTAASWAAIALAPAQHGQPALGWLMLACAAGTMVSVRSPALRPWLGLIERGYYAGMLAWLVLVAARLL